MTDPRDTMQDTQTQHKELVRREVSELFNHGQFDRVGEFVAEDYVGHNPAQPGESRGIEGYLEYVRAARTGFPDLHVSIEDVVADGDKVYRRTRTTGTHEGPFMGIEATGNSIDVAGGVIYRVEDGLITESWGLNDVIGMMRQLGVIES